ncbi:MAG: PIN domain-containing protein [Betaproteobacteria bacterium]
MTTRATHVPSRPEKAGVQVGTFDALLARLCIRHDLLLLTADDDFSRMAAHGPLRLSKALLRESRVLAMGSTGRVR